MANTFVTVGSVFPAFDKKSVVQSKKERNSKTSATGILRASGL